MSLKRTRFSLAYKRGLDIVISGIGLIVFSPMLLTVALIIRLTSPGPIFYLATRVGLHGKPIKVRKFRTMVADADKMGAAVTVQSDTQITGVGKFLRKWKLDELPQLLNTLEGTMSLVGPRPEDPRYVLLYSAKQRHVLDVPPGITSPASIKYRHEERMLPEANLERFYIEHVMPAKLEIELEYVETAGLFQDIKILFRTLLALFR